ncbi:hypothetical protein AKJ56_00355 [candidate division MSBL1 archaeon SCGC-AAA382N08]|uniref:DNA methyltransferase n=1 Tax=candidate division MSBL1 archaeon SCGC-AAA382N08 TaxID=1698285 RepID=A0A133VQP5_9EURY|nr:hypothetical protein AKJ56_00355 [candidate division MSBL1 archaeon SCGC-AAA382N08]
MAWARNENTEEYELIYADPPWNYNFSKTKNREIENHYETMDIEEIKDMDIPAEENCVLYMWTTAPKLKEAIEVIEEWGFEYKTCAIWNKKKLGMGYWFRGQHEILLVATRGDISPPKSEDRRSSIFEIERGKHSKKPDAFRKYIEKAHPNLSKIELFAREGFEGWNLHGNEKSKAKQRRLSQNV